MKKRVLTGIKPTGTPHIGNYLGAIKPSLSLMNDGDVECLFFIADIHALTTIHNSKQLQNNVYEIACTWLACGLDPNNVVFYKQSSIAEIFELCVILTNFTPKGLMNRAHAYKAQSESNLEKSLDIDHNINMGLYNYPILMAADILLFDTDLVPVGQDQKQHIEIARDIAQYFNNKFGSKLKLPNELITKGLEVLIGTDGRKMSKSYNNVIPLFSSSDVLKKSIFSIMTDSSMPNEPKETDSAIFKLYRGFATGDEIESFSNAFTRGISWREAKEELWRVVEREVGPMRERYNYFMENKCEVDNILLEGAAKAKILAGKKIDKVRRTLGI